MSEKLTVSETRKLQTLESRLHELIAADKAIKLEAGGIIRVIRDERLYRQNYSSFDAYIRDVFGWTSRRAYQLIKAVEIRQNVNRGSQTDCLPSTERQTRELAKAPPEKQAEVWESARQGRDPEKVTAKELAEARQAAGIPAPQTIKATAEEAQELYQARLMLEWAENFSGDARQIISSLREYIYNNYNSLSAQPNGHPLWRPLIQEFLNRFEDRFSSRPSLTKSDFAQLKSLFKRFPDKNIDWWQRGIDRFTHDTEEWVRDHGQPMRCFADHFNRWNPDKKTADELYREEIERAAQSIH